MNYKEFNIFYKYLYNRMNYYEFVDAMRNTTAYTSDSYIDEKWEQFKRDMVGFTATYDEKFFEYIKDKIEKENYKG